MGGLNRACLSTTDLDALGLLGLLAVCFGMRTDEIG